ncbi:NAD(P)-dependent dehydrogenase (short-subunit alcohol dehydrogenase family) [Yoonia maricola]|uniref:NAD(P)-dependent dehydrogenase (Short-subunit alcohol dehydrogenase family) n=1 Tax=Yoonia maricola TaxID=420999 RepID=A0A2M8W2K3_9RHOB|nr:SDR family oxidoreductase [Yoonia maricola]PJI85151.1 NAD(P)-dependent dehydrogenase (short-subunit alcohol dehydrogenase family) [Yoonia maricola]
MNATFHDLNGASVFITGGGSGIGAALTEGFVAQGAKVAFVDKLDAAALVTEMETKHGTAPLFIQGDITDTKTLQAAITQAADAHGPLNVLVNNAANDMRYDAVDITEDIWDAQQAINFKAYFFACQKAAEVMAPKGSIINYSSITYMMGLAGMTPYVSANAGIMGMTRALAREWGPKGIRVNAIAPGWVLTEKQEKMWATPEAKAAFLQKQCLQEFMQPDDMVGGTLFLASSASAMITGQTIAIDAGVVGTG